LALDTAGNLYIADPSNECVRKLTTTAQITTVAGNCEQGADGAGYAGDGGPATNAKLTGPSGIAVDAAGNLYIADTGNQRVRRVAANTGIIATIAGTGTPAFGGDGAAALNAQLNAPRAVAIDRAGNVFIADTLNHRVRKIAAKTGIITTVAGTGTPDYGGDGGPAASVLLKGPRGVALDSAGNLYIADTDNSRVRRVIAAGSP
jgi:NHL repeat